MTKFMSKSNNCNQSAIIFRIILCSGISLVLGAVLGHLLRTELFADINAEFEQILLALDTKSIHYPSLFRLCTSTQFKQLFLLCFFFTDQCMGFLFDVLLSLYRLSLRTFALILPNS